MTACRAAALVTCVLLAPPTPPDWNPPASGQEQGIPLYVGRDACLDCHAPEHEQRPCSLESIPQHNSAYDALTKPEAAHIAALSGIADPPQQSRVCLGCHATAADVGPRWTAAEFDLAHGVQCEACHQAGSLHVHVNRALAGKRKPTSLHGIRQIDRSICDSCHIQRPSHETVLKHGFRMALEESQYKTPINLATSPGGDRLYVVCERGNSLIVLDPDDGIVIDEIAVGQQPHDVAVSPDGGTLYVTNRLSDTLSVIDSGTRKVTATIAVGGEPHGVLTDATGKIVLVLNTSDDSISVIETEGLTEVKRLVAGRGPWSLSLRSDEAAFYVTNVRPVVPAFQQPPVSELTVVDAANTTVSSRATVPSANMMQGIATIPGTNVALATLMRTKNLVPITRLAQGWTITNGLGVLWPDGRVDQVLLDQPNAYFPDPGDIAVSPDGRHALVTSGGSDQVAVIDVDALLRTITQATDRERREVLPNHLGMSSRFVTKLIPTRSNPRGVTFAPDGRLAYVANALDDSITVIDTADFTVVRHLPLGGPRVITRLRRGERVFHDAEISFAQQFSCRSCHPDGHINGLTFDIEAEGIGMHPVDNRTLRGIFDTAPFKWEGTNPSLSHQCGPRLAVFFTRLDPYTPDELDALVRYMSTIQRPPNRNRRAGGFTPAQRRGKIVFERTTTNDGRIILQKDRCYTCHNGGYLTARTIASIGTTMWLDGYAEVEVKELNDVDEYGYLGLVYFHDTGTSTKKLDVPHLVNIHGSPPYLHNGAAPTLEEIWTRCNLYDEHGITSDLTRRQFNDLIAYLKAL